MPELRYSDERGQLHVYPLTEQEVTIGRSQNTCQVVVVDDMISREHARLEQTQDGRWKLADLGSRNRTYVNGQAIKEILLSSGDIIRMGSRTLEFVDESAAPATSVKEFLKTDREHPPGTIWVKIKDPLTLTLDQCALLTSLERAHATRPTAEQLAETLLSGLCRELGADRGFVASGDRHSPALQLLATRGFTLPGAKEKLIPVSQTFVYAGLLQQVAGRYPIDARKGPAEGSLAASGLVAPVVAEGKVSGVIYVDRLQAGKPFSAEAMNFIMAAGAKLGSLIDLATRERDTLLAEETMARLGVIRRLQAELNTAPESLELLRHSIRLLPGHERAGDLYQVLTLSGSRTLLLLADCGGMGISGLMQAEALLTAIKTAVLEQGDSLDLGQAANHASRATSDRGGRQPVSILAVLLDLAKGRLVYINAAYKTPLLLTAPGRLVTLDKSCLLMGVNPQQIYEETAVPLPAKFRLIIYSDGVSDAVNERQQLLSDQRVHELLLEPKAFAEPAAIVSALIEAVSRHLGEGRLEDDALFVALGKD
jgi:serine phosphatase RsbU (regulator of sigma subunit)/pSer/pThr/pTyr-binding forkhead associated (FHA) protein